MVFANWTIPTHFPPGVKENREADADRVKTCNRICLPHWKLLLSLAREVTQCRR